MYWLLFLTGPATYLMRVGGLLLARTRLAPRQMGSTLALVSTAVLAALVAPSLLQPAGHLAANPLVNPRLLVALLLVPLIWRWRRRVQVLLVVTLVGGMGVLVVLLWVPDLSITLSLPLALLLLASAGLAHSMGHALVRLRHQQRASRAGVGAQARLAVTVTPAERRHLPSALPALPGPSAAETQTHCVHCWCPLPVWANFCGQCGWRQPAPARAGLLTPRWAALRADAAPTQPLAAVTVRPRVPARPGRLSPGGAYEQQ